VFPFFPGDVAIFAAGFISGDDRSDVIIVLISAYIGSAIGLTLVYLAGKKYGRRIIASNKIKYINRDLLARTEAWYKRYGSKLLIVSKYLPGIRFALVFFSGVADMQFKKVFIYTSISCLIWNSMVILLAYYLRQNIGEVYKVLSTYSNVILYILILLAIIWIVKTVLKRRGSV
jgi:membrane-associated protein